MTTVSHGKPYAGNPHVRFEEGASESAKPSRNALLHNKWGLHDFHVVEQIFDRVDDSGRAALKVNKKDKKNISKLPDAQSDKDVFFWSNDRESASYLVRWPTGCALELKPKNSRTGFVRLVIGPDLVSEWKAKNGKK